MVLILLWSFLRRRGAPPQMANTTSSLPWLLSISSKSLNSGNWRIISLLIGSRLILDSRPDNGWRGSSFCVHSIKTLRPKCSTRARAATGKSAASLFRERLDVWIITIGTLPVRERYKSMIFLTYSLSDHWRPVISKQTFCTISFGDISSLRRNVMIPFKVEDRLKYRFYSVHKIS